MKEIRLLSGMAKDWVLEWVLARCKPSNLSSMPSSSTSMASSVLSNPSDWPVIFHNLLSSSVNPRIFETLVECLNLDESMTASRALMDHFIFLAGQNGELGRAWIRWVIGSRGPFGTSPLMFSGLLRLAQDMEYFDSLNTTLLNFIKCIQEIWQEVGASSGGALEDKLVNPLEYLEAVARCIPEDSESGIRAALLLVKNLSLESDLGGAFYLSLFRAHPFARRELLKDFSSADPAMWIKLYEIDEIIVREGIRGSEEKMKEIVKFVPELIDKVIEREDELEGLIEDDWNVRLKALTAIDSVILTKALQNSESIINFKSLNRMIEFSSNRDWKNVSLTEIGLMRSGLIQVSERKMVELCDLLLLPGVIEDRRDALMGLAVDFLAGYAEITKKERLGLISRLVSQRLSEESSLIEAVKFGSFEGVYALLDEQFSGDLSACSGTLKFLLQRTLQSSDPFYRIIPKIPSGSLELLIAAARAVADFEDGEDLGEEIGGLIGVMAGKVVAEPTLMKPLQGLLQKRWKSKLKPASSVCGLSKFAEISDSNLLRNVIDFGLKYGITGIRTELIKSILMYYGIIEDEDKKNGSGSGSGNGIISSKFKHLHLNEKSVTYALNALLNEVQNDLMRAHKLLKLYPALFHEHPDEFVKKWVMEVAETMLLGLTRGLIGGKAVPKLHLILASFYDLCTRLVKLIKGDEGAVECENCEMKKLTRLVGEQLNRQIYALIPLQQEKMQTNLKQSLNLKKSHASSTKYNASSSGKSVTLLVYAMEKYEEAFLKLVRESKSNAGWSERIVRSTARDFKIKLEEL